MKRYYKSTFFLLTVAFVVSAAYQYYRSILAEVPVHDDFGMKGVAWYAIAISFGAVSLFNSKWSDLFILFFCSLLYLAAFLYYFPVVYSLRNNGLIDIAEAVLYMALIFMAAVLAVLSLRARAKKPLGTKPEQKQ
ncbi:hypothetical protein [Cesiribacter sp. SM1]|uniref:hypothetical protein n=1 Tax=Cesiribacter sp. SM1 TaxID=2861196 RepID=UPI001CD26054|nr:hypothetical protein [Cesiribacter sp. SM1]